MQPPDVIEENVHFFSDGLRLEGVLAYPGGDRPRAAVLLLNPHPHLGGNMKNNVVCHMARRASEEGAVSLRFNYRGVGASEIRLPEGGAVQEYFAALEAGRDYAVFLPDCVAALKCLEEAAQGAARRVVVGYSLGAVLAPMLAKAAAVDCVVAIGPPNRRVSMRDYETCPGEKVFVGGDRDFVFDPEQFAREYERFPGLKTCLLLPGCDHFFRRGEERAYQSVRRHLLPGAE